MDMFVVRGLILLSSYLRMNGKLTEELLETFLGLSSGLLPVGNTLSMINMHIMFFFTELMDAKVILYCLALIFQALLTEFYWHWHIQTVGWMCKHVMLPCNYHQAQCKSNLIITIEREAKISHYSYQLAKEGVTAVLIE